jgi:hypothetical protein
MFGARCVHASRIDSTYVMTVGSVVAADAQRLNAGPFDALTPQGLHFSYVLPRPLGLGMP